MTQASTQTKAGEFGRAFLVIGCLSFGGPAGQIATMHRELVEKRGWIADDVFLKALNFCMLLPGPEAQQLATWCGWRLRGVRGGLVAGLLFVLPGALVMAALVALYIGFGRLGAVQAVFAGVQAAVVAVVAQAVLRVAGRALKDAFAWGLALAAFTLITLLDLPFPLVIALAALAGALRARAVTPREAARAADEPMQAKPASWRHSLWTLAIGALVWLAPLAVAATLLGPAHPLVALGNFFARLAAFSFGGAYAGLAYVAQGAAAGPGSALGGWVSPAQIVDGLALAETTPGPLVLVYQFIGGLAGQHILGGWVGVATGMILVLWLTFAPSFVFIFALAPQLERLMARPGLARALAGVTAAVVGVIASLGLWFALHVLFASVGTAHIGPLRLWLPGGTVNLFSVAIALIAIVLLTRARIGMVPVLALAGGAGLARWLLNGS